MKKKLVRNIILFALILTAQFGFSQLKPSVSIGAEVVSFGGIMGIGGDNEVIIPLKPYLSCGVNMGFAMSSDKTVNTSQPGSFNQNAIFFGDLSIQLNPTLFNGMELALFGGGGIRHFQSTQILVNSDLETSPNNEFLTEFGLMGGLGVKYAISNNYTIGIKYKHDFYKDGFDYIGIAFGIKLN